MEYTPSPPEAANPVESEQADHQEQARPSERRCLRWDKVHVHHLKVLNRADSETGHYQLGLDWTSVANELHSVGSWEALRSEQGRIERGKVGHRVADQLLAERGAVKLLQAERDAAADQLPDIHHWHIKADGLIYQRNGEHSSQVVRFEGRIVQTSRGSSYRVGELDPDIMTALSAVGAPFDPETPFASLEALLYAERIVYGAAAEPSRRVVDALHDLYSAIDKPTLTDHHFASLFTILHQLGIVIPSVILPPIDSSAQDIAMQQQHQQPPDEQPLSHTHSPEHRQRPARPPPPLIHQHAVDNSSTAAEASLATL